MTPEAWPPRPACEAKGCDCHPHESKQDFDSWKESGLCLACWEKELRDLNSDLKGIA